MKVVVPQNLNAVHVEGRVTFQLEKDSYFLIRILITVTQDRKLLAA